jgi:hypothetical protein
MRYSHAELCLTSGAKCPTRGIQVLWTWDVLRHSVRQVRTVRTSRNPVRASSGVLLCLYPLQISGIYDPTRIFVPTLKDWSLDPSSCMVSETHKLSRRLQPATEGSANLTFESDSGAVTSLAGVTILYCKMYRHQSSSRASMCL